MEALALSAQDSHGLLERLVLPSKGSPAALAPRFVAANLRGEAVGLGLLSGHLRLFVFFWGGGGKGGVDKKRSVTERRAKGTAKMTTQKEASVTEKREKRTANMTTQKEAA